MAEEMIDSTWGKEGIKRLDYFEKKRNLTIRAIRESLRDFYRDNFVGNETVLEIGSGTGFWRRNWPSEFNGEWVQLEPQIAFLEEAKKRFPQSTYLNGSAYDLPLDNRSLDVVCGFSSYDVLMNLEAAVKEASRVLKEGGLFFHMMDLAPCSDPILEDLRTKRIPHQEKGSIDSDGYWLSQLISFIPEERV